SDRDWSSDVCSSDLRTTPRPYKEVITDKAVTRTGFFKVHKVDDKYFFEIPDDILGRDILVVNRISKTQVGVGYSGDQIGQSVIRSEERRVGKECRDQ